jgi:hypothetical protein
MIFALFNLGPGEVILIVALVLILYLGPMLPNLTPGLDERAKEMGRTLGGIYGKRAGEALTPNNQTAELYDPAALDGHPHKRGALRNFVRRCRIFWVHMCKVISSWIRATLIWRKQQ